MPFNETDAYLVEGRWRCASCFFYLATEDDPAAVPSVPAPGRACDECGINLIVGDPAYETELARQERVDLLTPEAGVCGWCEAEGVTDTLLGCYICDASGCFRHTHLCACGRRACPSHYRICTCNGTVVRCMDCQNQHAATCPRLRAPPRIPKYPAFPFLCDSSEDLVKEKHQRPRLLDKHGNPRRRPEPPRPGVFVEPADDEGL